MSPSTPDDDDDEIGISYVASNSYSKLNGLLRPDKSVSLPLQFYGDTDEAKAKAKAAYFLELMKALLRSRIIAKSPLKNASDIRALQKLKVAFEANKGYERRGLMKLLITTYRLWTPTPDTHGTIRHEHPRCVQLGSTIHRSLSLTRLCVCVCALIPAMLRSRWSCGCVGGRS